MLSRIQPARTLRARFLFALVLIGILPLGLAGTGVAILDRQVLTEQSARELTGLARGLAGQMDAWLAELLIATDTIAALPDVAGVDPAQQNQSLQTVFQHYRYFARLSTFDLSGLRLASSHEGGATSVAERDSFQAAIRGRQAWEVGRALSTGRPSLLIHTPIRDGNRQVAAVLGAVIDLEQLSLPVGRLAVGNGGQAFVLDAQGRALLHRDPGAIDGRIDLRHLANLVGGRAAGPGIVRYTMDGTSFIAGYAPVSNATWTVFTEQPESEVLAPADRSWQLTLGALGASALIAIVAAGLLARTLTRPVGDLVAAARAFAAGDASTPLPAGSPDQGELGSLIAAFAEMRTSVSVALTGLRVSEERFRRLAENAPDLIFRYEIGPSCAFSFVSPAASRIFGYGPEDFYADSELLLGLAHADDRASLRGLLTGLNSDGPTVFRLQSRDRETVWMSIHCSSVLDERGVVVACEGIARDITRTMRSELALQDAEAKYRGMFENAVIGIVQSTPQGRVIDANAAAARIYGYSSPSDFIAAVSDVGQQLFTDSAGLDEFLRLLEVEGMVTALEVRQRRRDGKDIWVSLSARTVRDNEGATICYEAMVEDVTERKRSEALQQELLRKIRTSGARLRGYLESAPDGVVITDSEGRIRLVNSETCRMFGYTRGELNRKPVEVLMPERFRRAHQGHRSSFLTGPRTRGLAANVELTAQRKDGSEFPVEISLSALEDRGERLAIAVVRDVTERKRTEESVALLAAIVASSGEAIIGTTVDGTINSWNAGAEQLFGYTAEDAIGSPITMIAPPERAKEVRRNLEYVTLGGRVEHFESVRIRRDGQAIQVFTSISPVKDALGRITGTSAITQDITARKQAEANIARLAAIVESSADAIVSTDLDGTILTWNAAAEWLYGFTPAEAVGRPITLVVGPGEAADVIDIVRRANQGEHVDQIERRRVRKDGQLIDVSISVSPIRDASGEVIATFAITRDITRSKRAEVELKESNRRLEDALRELQQTQQQIVQQERLRALGQMASGIAHDFNNALSPILGFSELLLASPDQLADRARVRQYLQLMNTGAKDAAVVVSRLREFYRHRDQGDPEIPVDLEQVVSEASALTQPKWKDQALARGITIALVTDLQDVPPVRGNPAEIRELLTNLIFNAADAMPEGGIITVSTRREGDQVVLEVSDTGTGMTGEIRRRCLEPFFSTKGERGTGLGLSMVHGIVSRHGGSLDVKSAPGEGTTIRVAFPVATEDPAAQTAAARGVGPSPRQRVLLVDDEPMIREVVTEYLKLDGHVVHQAASGQDALKEFRTQEFDVVITDRAMPGMNGDQLAVALKRMRPDMPVILLTGFGDMMEAGGERPTGIDVILAKPPTLAAVRQGLVDALKHRNVAGQTSDTRYSHGVQGEGKASRSSVSRPAARRSPAQADLG